MQQNPPQQIQEVAESEDYLTLKFQITADSFNQISIQYGINGTRRKYYTYLHQKRQAGLSEKHKTEAHSAIQEEFEVNWTNKVGIIMMLNLLLLQLNLSTLGLGIKEMHQK